MKKFSLNNKIKYTSENDIEFIQFKKLLEYPEVNHAYFLKGNYTNFRMGKNFKNIDAVKNNLKLVCEKTDIDYYSIVRPDFEHTSNVQCVKELVESRPEIQNTRFKETDGIITQSEGITLMATNADCNIILLYDPIKHVIGNIHAGWRGTFGKIVKNAILKMKEEYNSNPKDIMAFFCPSIRKCHFEVDFDVANECIEIFKYTNRLDEIIEKGQIKDDKQKYNIDLILINKILLEEEGIVEKNIYDSEICSVCNSDKIHSKRADGINFGLGSALIEIKSVKK